MPPIEQRQSVMDLPESERYFLYHIPGGDLPGKLETRFMLVEVNGHEERILDSGRASGLTLNGAGYCHFKGTGYYGTFEYYCTAPERPANARLKFVRSLIA